MMITFQSRPTRGNPTKAAVASAGFHSMPKCVTAREKTQHQSEGKEMSYDSLHWLMLLVVVWSVYGWYRSEISRRTLFEDLEDLQYEYSKQVKEIKRLRSKLNE